MKAGVVACGALALHVRRLALDRGWDVEIRPAAAAAAQPSGADRRRGGRASFARSTATGSRSPTPTAARYGALDEVLSEHGASGSRETTATTCSPRDEVREALAEEPGTYFLTDFLVKTFDASVARPLRLPELRDAYFANYTRVLWLAQEPTPELLVQAEHAAEIMGLRLEVREVGTDGLERQLEQLVGSARAMTDFPSSAKAVVVGAGIVGNSMVHHLARLGWRDLVLLDKGALPEPRRLDRTRVELHLPRRPLEGDDRAHARHDGPVRRARACTR